MKEYNVNYEKYFNVLGSYNGLLEINDNSIPHDVVLAHETNDLFLVHATNFFPNHKVILSNCDGNKKYPFLYSIDPQIYMVKDSISPRQTVHFTLNGKVENTSMGEGKWDEPKFIIIEPYDNHMYEFVSGIMHGGDNYTENSVKLSDDAILMVREDVLNELSDEQKQMYKIVVYKGNANECVDNFLTSMGIPKIENPSWDRTHNDSKQIQQEMVLEKRSQAIKIIKNADLNNNNETYGFTEEEIFLLSKLANKTYEFEPLLIEKLKKGLNIDSDLLANFIISNGVVKTSIDGYKLLTPKEVTAHWSDADFYIRSIKEQNLNLDNLNKMFNEMSIEDVQSSSLLEKNYQFNDISIGQLQTMKNFGVLIKLKEQLNLAPNQILLMREDGLYLSQKDLDTYKEKSNTEILLGRNIDTIGSVINNYTRLIESFYERNTPYLDSSQLDINEEEMSSGGRHM